MCDSRTLRIAHVRSLCTTTSRANMSRSPVTMRISVTGSSVLNSNDSIAAEDVSVRQTLDLGITLNFKKSCEYPFSPTDKICQTSQNGRELQHLQELLKKLTRSLPSMEAITQYSTEFRATFSPTRHVHRDPSSCRERFFGKYSSSSELCFGSRQLGRLAGS